MEFPFLWLFAASLVVTLASMPLVRRLGSQFGLMDHPHERKLQRTAVPRTGGIAILLGIGAGLGTLYWLSGDLGIPLGREVLAICVGGLVIHATGVLDDLWDLPAKVKLLAQGTAVGIVVMNGVTLDMIVLPDGAVIELGVFAIPLTAFFLLGLVNSINLVDGLDGLASGIAGTASLALVIAGVLTGNALMAAFSTILLASVFGFLPFNFGTKSKTFLGDAGSMLLGWMLGVIAISGARFSGDSTPIFIVLACVSVPIFDTATTIVRRSRNRQAIFRPDSMHIHHRLIRFGLTPRRTVLTILAVTLFAAGQSLAFFVEGTRLLLVASTLAVALVVVQLRRPSRENLVQSDASFREIVFYLLGTQNGTSPRMRGDLAIVDLLQESPPAPSQPAVAATPPSVPAPFAETPEEREPVTAAKR